MPRGLGPVPGGWALGERQYLSGVLRIATARPSVMQTFRFSVPLSPHGYLSGRDPRCTPEACGRAFRNAGLPPLLLGQGKCVMARGRLRRVPALPRGRAPTVPSVL